MTVSTSTFLINKVFQYFYCLLIFTGIGSTARFCSKPETSANSMPAYLPQTGVWRMPEKRGVLVKGILYTSWSIPWTRRSRARIQQNNRNIQTWPPTGKFGKSIAISTLSLGEFSHTYGHIRPSAKGYIWDLKGKPFYNPIYPYKLGMVWPKV